MYLQTQSDVQVPWLWMFCIETFELKARVAPERLKVWIDMPECWRPTRVSICVKFRLTLVSVRGTHWAASFFIWKRGSFFVPGVMSNKFFIAWTGHKGEDPRDRIFNILMVSLVWIVLLHLINKWIPGGTKNTSPLAICSIGEKALIEWGTKLEIRRNEKNAVKYKALKICPIHMVSQILVIEASNGISIIFFTTGANVLCNDNDFWKYMILGSWNEYSGRPYRAKLAFTADR